MELELLGTTEVPDKDDVRPFSMRLEEGDITSLGGDVVGGVVNAPGTHAAYQGREPKPKTGGSRPGSSSRGTTPPSQSGVHGLSGPLFSKAGYKVRQAGAGDVEVPMSTRESISHL